MNLRTIFRLCAIVTMTLAIAACNGTGGDSHPQHDSTANTLMGGKRHGKRNSQQRQQQQQQQGTGEYRSTGDATLLNVKLPDRLDNQVVKHYAITVHYNKYYRLPNCVAYELTATQTSMSDAPGAEKRSNYQFERDTKAQGCPDWWEYKNTGYDRGHMAPAMDMRWNKQAMSDCFLMSNMCPQRHDLNDGEWRHMEEAIHNWARKMQRLVIFTGPILTSNMKRIGPKHDIAVPEAFFKVVYAPDKRKAIAFIMENREATRSWTRYATTIDQVEQRTGYDFLSALPDDVEQAVESMQNINDWPTYTPRR